MVGIPIKQSRDANIFTILPHSFDKIFEETLLQYYRTASTKALEKRPPLRVAWNARKRGQGENARKTSWRGKKVVFYLDVDRRVNALELMII